MVQDNENRSDNILFNLPYDEERYKLTLEVGTGMLTLYTMLIFAGLCLGQRFGDTRGRR